MIGAMSAQIPYSQYQYRDFHSKINNDNLINYNHLSNYHYNIILSLKVNAE